MTFSNALPAHAAWRRAPLPFGWSNRPGEAPRPEQYTLSLQRSDLAGPINLESPEPAPGLVDRIVRQLSHGLENDRFVVLSGLKPLLQESSRVHRFQENLMKAIYQRVRQTGATLVPSPKEHVLLCQLINGYGPTTTMHWDFKEWPLLSLSYQHSPALKNYHPLLADSAQLFHDVGRSMPNGEATSNEPDRILAQHQEHMKQTYLIPLPLETVEDIPILIVNNNRWNGVLHGAMKPGEGRYQTERILYQVALSEADFPARKFARLEFDQHKQIELGR